MVSMVTVAEMVKALKSVPSRVNSMMWEDEEDAVAVSRQRTTIEHRPPNWSLRRRVIAAVLLPVTLYFTIMSFGIMSMVMSRSPGSLPTGLEWVSRP